MLAFPRAGRAVARVRGIGFRGGSLIFRDSTAPADAIVVERMKGAGAIIIGKTNTPEFGLGSQTHNPVFGTTLNPYDLTKTCGGSSGGAGLSPALRMLPASRRAPPSAKLRHPGARTKTVWLHA